ncbi:MAG: hypothetical protein KDA65_17495, partial [Planctomycetaceae bacterium]|nr:hypothetical protein [Planctomycetaceae bacterium]
MNRMIWKELRENWKWSGALLLVGYFILWMFTGGYTPFFFEDNVTLVSIYLFSVIIGLLWGIKLTWAESAPDRWAFLMHRPQSMRSIALTRNGVVCLLQLVGWALVLVATAIYFNSTQTLRHPFYWRSLISPFLIASFCVPASLVGQLMVLWKTRYKLISYLLPLPFLMLLPGLQAGSNFIREFKSIGIWYLFLMNILFSLFLLRTVLSSYEKSGDLETISVGRKLPAMIFVSIAMYLGVLFFGMLVGSQVRPAHNMAIQQIVLTKTGEPLVMIEQMDSSDPQKKLVQLCQPDNLQSPVREALISAKSGLDYVAVIEEFDELAVPAGPIWNSLAPYKTNRRYGTIASSISSETLDVVSEHQIMWIPEFFARFSMQAYYSHVDDLIHVYYTDDEQKGWEAMRIGQNGFARNLTSEMEPFSGFVGADQDLIRYKIDYPNRSSVLAVDANNRFLMVTPKAIFDLSVLDQTIKKVYSADSGESIVDVHHFPSQDPPLFVVEYESSYRILKAETEPLHDAAGSDLVGDQSLY